MPPLEAPTPELAPLETPEQQPPLLNLNGPEQPEGVIGGGAAAAWSTITAIATGLATKGTKLIKPELKRQTAVCDQVRTEEKSQGVPNPKERNPRASAANDMIDEDEDVDDRSTISIVTPGAQDPAPVRTFDAVVQTHQTTPDPPQHPQRSYANVAATGTDANVAAPGTYATSNDNTPQVVQVLDPHAIDELRRLNYQLGHLIHEVQLLTPAARAMQSMVTRTKRLQQQLDSFETFFKNFY